MDVVTTSLDALLQRATNPSNETIDTAAVDAFCALVNKEKDGPHIGAKLIASKIHSQKEKEVLQILHILEFCMLKCGSQFQSEVGKFRFLNEMIKLVSPKYLGSQTPLAVRQKVLQLMYIWTLDYPKETKIKEAYDMLKKQGVIKEVPLSVSAESYTVLDRKSNSIFQDEEKSKLLQKLLQSKNPEDLQAANRLIKSMVKEDDKRAELKSKRVSVLESVHNNIRLLNEMLDTYKPNISSQDDLELINELHQSCEKFKPTVIKLASESQQNEEIFNDVLQASEELNAVCEKYKSIILEGKVSSVTTTNAASNSLSLLDIDPLETDNATMLLRNPLTPEPEKPSTRKPSSDLDVLCDIFASNDIATEVPPTEILQPSVLKGAESQSEASGTSTSSKLKALEELDALGEHLLRENLQSTTRIGPQFNKPPEKIPMNLLPKQNDIKLVQNNSNKLDMGDALNLDLRYLEDKTKVDVLKTTKYEDTTGDDVLVDITENINTSKTDIAETIQKDDIVEEVKKPPEENSTKPKDVKLSDIFVRLESIKPSSVPPIVALEEKNGISVTLHFAKDKPREDVTVVVVTVISKNESPLKNILFRAIVPKTCKVKLQPASGTDLPSFNPFLPPSAITQIMLITNPENIDVSLKFIVSYNIDDETTTEMGEIERLPQIV